MATVPLSDVATKVTPELAKQLRLATREAVNKVALELTRDARERTKLVTGGDQRLSGSRITSSWHVEHPGTEGSRRIYTAPVAGGRKVNPAYKQADSVTNPTAVIGARGPMHWLEHDRKGGYDIRPRRARATSDKAVADLDRLNTELFGRSPRGGAARTKHAPALKVAGKYYGAVKGGGIIRPLGGPMTATMRAAPRTVARLAERVLDERMARTMQGF
jgi:hypothetical protein